MPSLTTFLPLSLTSPKVMVSSPPPRLTLMFLTRVPSAKDTESADSSLNLILVLLTLVPSSKDTSPAPSPLMTILEPLTTLVSKETAAVSPASTVAATLEALTFLPSMLVVEPDSTVTLAPTTVFSTATSTVLTPSTMVSSTATASSSASGSSMLMSGMPIPAVAIDLRERDAPADFKGASLGFHSGRGNFPTDLPDPHGSGWVG